MGCCIIAPYLSDIIETCHFLCADFDDKEYEKDALAFCEICDELNISAHIERFRSGGGKPDMARGGGKDASKVDVALEAVVNYLK